MYATRVKSSNPPIKIALLEERSEKNLAKYCWNLMMFFAYTISIFGGMITHTSLMDNENNADFCPLFANFSNFFVNFEKARVNFELSTDTSSICAACRYISILCCSGGGILALIYLKFWKNLKANWKYRALMITLHFLFFGLSISTGVMTIKGISVMCKNIQKITNDLDNFNCDTYLFLKWHDSTEDFIFYKNAFISQIGPVISLLGWGLGIMALLSFRDKKKQTSDNSTSRRPADFCLIDQKEDKIEMGAERTRGHSECSTEGLLMTDEKKARKNLIFWPCRKHI